jgi:hypothetical protein
MSGFICSFAECHYAECHYAECHYAECRYAECHYAECNGAAYFAWGVSYTRKIFYYIDHIFQRYKSFFIVTDAAAK